jgi:hypothetical protein
MQMVGGSKRRMLTFASLEEVRDEGVRPSLGLCCAKGPLDLGFGTQEMGYSVRQASVSVVS